MECDFLSVFLPIQHILQSLAVGNSFFCFSLNDFTLLNLYQTIPSFNNPDGKSLLKTMLVKEKILVTSIFFFSYNVLGHSVNKMMLITGMASCIWFVTCKCLNLHKPNSLIFGKELTLNQMTNFYTGPNWKHLQTTK